MTPFVQRMVGAAKLDPAIYEEVEHDTGSMGQALGVVVLSSVAAGIGSALYMNITTAVIVGTIAALLGWIVWALLTWVIGTKLLPEESTEADIGQLLRTVGFAASPGILRVVGIVPGIGGVLVLACDIWMLAAMVVGVRQALDYTSTWRAVGVCVIGWVILIIVQMGVFALVGAPGSPTAAG